MTADFAVWCLLITNALSIASLVTCVVVFSRRASRCIRALKRKPSSESTLARVRADLVELFGLVESLSTTVKRLSSRRGMAEMRERRAAELANAPPPPEASKAEKLRYYGMNGKMGPEFARAMIARDADVQSAPQGAPTEE